MAASWGASHLAMGDTPKRANLAALYEEAMWARSTEPSFVERRRPPRRPTNPVRRPTRPEDSRRRGAGQQ